MKLKYNFKILIIALASLMPGLLYASSVDSMRTVQHIAPTAARIGTSIAINAGLTEILKSTIHEMRPDRSGNDSWPSRHTSWTFAVASIAAHELYSYNKWWVSGAHIVANSIAMQRIYSDAHYPKDVLGGAMVGLVSTEIGYLIANKIFPGSYRTLPHVVSDWKPALDITTIAAFPLNGTTNDINCRTSINTSIRLNLPIANKVGLTTAMTLRAMPMFGINGSYISSIGSAGISAGIMGHIDIPVSRWSMEAHLLPGITHNFKGAKISYPSWCFTLDVSASAVCRLTSDLALGIECGYSYWALRDEVNLLNIGIFSRILF